MRYDLKLKHGYSQYVVLWPMASVGLYRISHHLRRWCIRVLPGVAQTLLWRPWRSTTVRDWREERGECNAAWAAPVHWHLKTLIFTGTLGALRCSANYAAYGAGRASVRQLSQSLAREMSEKGIHVAHTIANGGIADEKGEDQKIGKRMSAEAVGKTYLWLHEQEPCLWTSELDMRPALEKFWETLTRKYHKLWKWKIDSIRSSAQEWGDSD